MSVAGGSQDLALPQEECTGDSRLRYDASVGRWYRTGLWQPNHQLCLAVSKTSDPTAGWWIGKLSTTPVDFMRMAFSRDWIVIVNLDSTVTFVAKAAAVNGDFRTTIVRTIGLPWAVPVQNLYGTTLPTFLSIEPAAISGFPLRRVWTHDVFANATTVTAPAPVPDTDFWSGPPARTPSGTILSGQALTEAWQSADGRWIIGTRVANFQLAPHAYLITLDAQRGYNPADDGTAFRFANMPTIHPALAVTPANTSFVTAIETSSSVTPTHVFSTTTVTDRGAVNMVSVQDAAAAIGHPEYTPTGNGSGPVPLDPYGSLDIRGPDYLDAVPDVNNGVWFVGQWVSGGQWYEHIT